LSWVLLKVRSSLHRLMLLDELLLGELLLRELLLRELLLRELLMRELLLGVPLLLLLILLPIASWYLLSSHLLLLVRRVLRSVQGLMRGLVRELVLGRVLRHLVVTLSVVLLGLLRKEVSGPLAIHLPVISLEAHRFGVASDALGHLMRVLLHGMRWLVVSRLLRNSLGLSSFISIFVVGPPLLSVRHI